MPTMAASAASRPRIWLASSSTSASASGSEGFMGPGVVEEALQDHGGGERVHVAGTARPRRVGLELVLRGGRGERLVNEGDRTAVPRRESSREFLGEARHGVRRSIRVFRAPDDETRGLPFGDDALDRREARLVGLARDGGEGARD